TEVNTSSELYLQMSDVCPTFGVQFTRCARLTQQHCHFVINLTSYICPFRFVIFSGRLLSVLEETFHYRVK
ncbi:hypothetical protein, partial [Serratia fonticola]